MPEPTLPLPPMRVLGIPRMHDEDTLYPSRWRVLWCRLTLRHGGHVGSGQEGVYWQCVNCTKRVRATHDA